ncbi:MAG: hypothetical protein AAB375_03620 [Patescibacteria group bacterium]
MKNLQLTTNDLQPTTSTRSWWVVAVLVVSCQLSVVGYAVPAMALNIDATNKYAWGENVGWINFGSTEGDVDVTATTIDGYAWGENVGWISLTCSNTSSCATVNYGVEISGSTVTGYAWGENVGWISFNCSNTSSCGTVNYGVSLDTATGDFSGYAWGENVGWIVFNCSTTSSCGTVSYKLNTNFVFPTPTPGGGGVIILGTPPSAPSPTPTSSPTASPTASPTVSPTASPTPSVSVIPPTPTVPPPSVAPTAPPPSSGGIGGGVVQVITTAAQAIDSVVNRVLGEATSPVVATTAATAVTAVAIIPVAAAAAGAMAQKEVAASTFQLLQVIGIRKRTKVWGVIYDSTTKRPIPLAKIELLDSSGRILETRYGDRDGRYGFLTSPASLHAPELRVRIRVQKPGYAFPSMQNISGTDFVVYDNIYRGGELVLQGDALVHYNIPLDPAVAGSVALKKVGWSLLGSIGNRLLSFGFYIGLVAVPLNLYFLPNATNIAIFTVFFLVNAIQLLVLHRPYGVTLDALTGKRLPFTLVTLNDLQGNRVNFSVSDEHGRFILSGEQGKDYEILAYTPANTIPQRSIRLRVRGLKRLVTRAWITAWLRI